jgi:hypothetical protein
VRPAAGAAIDSDVNDPVAIYQPNGTVADAQPIPNPVTLGGYANQPGSGPIWPFPQCGRCCGRLPGQSAGWPVSLISVIASDGVRNDLDLGLYDLTGKLLDACSQSESRRVADGREEWRLSGGGAGDQWCFQLCADLGSVRDGDSANGMRLNDQFVAGQAVVKFRDDRRQ